MDKTEHLQLPYLFASQAQKHVIHNEALRALDAITQLAVISRSIASPPLSPDEGDRYLIASGADDAWTGHDGDVTIWQDGAWAFHTPRAGWRGWIADEMAVLVYDGAAWLSLGGSGGSINPAPLVGVNATADTTNRLSVSSPASLFNHEGAGHQAKINKALVTDTASLLFQTGFSGRAEFGTTGDDDFHVKVSADGTAWNEAIVIDKATGAVSFPNTALGGGTGPSLKTVIFTSPGTWTKPMGLQAVRVTVVAGGGGGAGAAGASGMVGYGRSGGGGGASRTWIAAAALGATEAVTVGAAGAGGAAGANVGSAGGTSSFGAHCSATGGSGGAIGLAGGTSQAITAGANGGGGVGGDENYDGGGADPSARISGTVGWSGRAGNSMLGQGARGAFDGQNGIDGNAFGGGGSAGVSNSATGRSGGAGANGIVIVEEIY